jgi:carbamoyltransferase
MNVLGISAFFHESACCLLTDGQLVAAVEEERFSRIKHDRGFPMASLRYCLDAGGIDLCDVDCIAYYEEPSRKLSRQLWSGHPGKSLSELWNDARRPEQVIREHLGFDGAFRTYGHHRSHAAAAFLFSGFSEAAILTVDGVGEWATTSYGVGLGTDLSLLEEVHFPHSLGLLYSAITG